MTDDSRRAGPFGRFIAMFVAELINLQPRSDGPVESPSERSEQ